MADQRRYSTTTSLIIAKAAVDREARRARRALWVERGLQAFWPVWTLIALFGGLVLLGLPSLLPAAWHYALLAGFAAAGLFFAIRGAVGIVRPTTSEALALLDEGVRGRPAQTYSDALAAGAADRGTQALWAAHQRTLAEKAAALTARAPDLRVSSRDPYALRHGALIALAAGLIGYFGADVTRISDQIAPGAIAMGAPVPTPTVEAWASPPIYTGVPPVYLTRMDRAAGTIALPVGTEISLRVFDVPVAPVLTETVSGATVAFADSGAGVYDATLKVVAGGTLSITSDGDTMGGWSIAVIPDTVPTIAFDGIPNGGERGALMLSFIAGDDYGVRRAQARIELDADAVASVPGLRLENARPSVYEPIELELPLPLTGDGREIAETLIEDLTEHPWAGLPVKITLTAEDAAAQSGMSQMITTMPGRRFVHPMAKALIEQRRAIAFSPDAAPRALDVLEAVMIYPEDMFDDTTAYLAARMAVRRLGYALEDGTLAAETTGIVDLLWKAAIRLEDGDLSNAAERLARAQERLKDAIENGASDDEIARLMQDLREAMQDYMQQLAQEAQRDQSAGQQPQPQDGDQQTITQDDIEKMLQELEEAMRNGQQELARQMLQALQQMMNNMQMAQPGQGQPGEGDQTMDQMGDMIGEQQGLADRSFDQMRRGQQGQQGQGQQQGEQQQQGERGDQPGQNGSGNGEPGDRPGDDPGQIARDQRDLQKLLDELRRNLPGSAGEGTREALDEAERAMGDAVDSLEQGDTRQAVDDQVRALDALRDGRRQLGQDMAEAQAQGQGDQAGREGEGGDAEREDPLGRPTASDGPLSGDSVKVPGASLGKRARELQDEIRRRSGEQTRPAEELDYLERLLDRF